MPKLTFNSSTYTLNDYESVLDCLLRHQEYIPYACRAGMCQACLVRVVDCEATPESKKWIKESLQQKGYTLACQWVPKSDVSVALPTVEEFAVATRIKSLEPLNDNVMRMLLEVIDRDTMFHYYPGQYVTLVNPQGIARSYSVANDFENDQHLEFHISETSDGLFTKWLFDSASVGDILHMRGPSGDCYYSNTAAEDFTIILAGTGTGLAPLMGIARDALESGHNGDIQLYHGSRSSDQLYCIEALEALEESYPQFRYFPCVKEDSGKAKVKNRQAGSVEEVMDRLMDTGSLARARVYICGAPDFVHGLRRKIFLKGASSGNMHCDPFLERSVAPTGGTN